MTRNFFKYGVFGQCKGYLNDIYLNTMSCLLVHPSSSVINCHVHGIKTYLIYNET